jgi:hypothetical protein
MARLPVPHATSDTRIAGPIVSRSTNSSAAVALHRAICPEISRHPHLANFLFELFASGLIGRHPLSFRRVRFYIGEAV